MSLVDEPTYEQAREAAEAATPMLSVHDILSADDLPTDTVYVPEWNGRVKVRGFTKSEQMRLREEARVGEEIDPDRLELLMFIHGVVEPQFSPEDSAALLQKNAAAVDRVLKVVLRLSGIGQEAIDNAKRTFPEGT